jgi:hypothetical protein
MFASPEGEWQYPHPTWLAELRVSVGLPALTAPRPPVVMPSEVATGPEQHLTSAQAKQFFKGLTVSSHGQRARATDPIDNAKSAERIDAKNRLNQALDEDDYGTAWRICNEVPSKEPEILSVDVQVVASLAGKCDQDFWVNNLSGLSPTGKGDLRVFWASAETASRGTVFSGQHEYLRECYQRDLLPYPPYNAMANWVTDDPKVVEVASLLLFAHETVGSALTRALYRKILRMDPGNRLIQYWFTRDYSGPMSLREKHLKALLPLVPEGEVKEGYRKQLAYYHQKAMEETPTP